MTIRFTELGMFSDTVLCNLYLRKYCYLFLNAFICNIANKTINKQRLKGDYAFNIKLYYHPVDFFDIYFQFKTIN